MLALHERDKAVARDKSKLTPAALTQRRRNDQRRRHKEKKRMDQAQTAKQTQGHHGQKAEKGAKKATVDKQGTSTPVVYTGPNEVRDNGGKKVFGIL